MRREKMITAKFYRNKSGAIDTYTLSGHACYAEYGKDIVCAGVSSLYIAITNELKNYVKTVDISDLSENGVMIEQTSAISDVLTKTLLSGLKGIAEQYPQNIKVTEHEQ